MSKLETAIYVYRLLENIEINARQVTGILPNAKYIICKQKLESSALLLNSKDDLCQVEFNLPSEQNGVFAVDIDDLLKAPSRRLSPPREFYVADIDYFSSEGNIEDHDVVRNYLDAALFASALISISDHSLPLESKAIFLQGEKLELSLFYSFSDLSRLNGLKEFIFEFVEAEIHKDQKATIIKAVLIEMLKNNEIDQLTISCLIKRFHEFIERVSANYQLYVSEFSFDKIKEQVESEKLEFTLKLNKVFSDIQNQLLAVPIALVLVSSQMKVTSGLSLVNLSIWCGVIIFGVFMSLLIRNQRSTLNAIKLEVDSQWRNIKNRHKFVAERLGEHYSQLQKRQQSQKLFLELVSIIVSIAILISTTLLLYNSQSLHLYWNVLLYGGAGGALYILVCLVVIKKKQFSVNK